MSINNLYPETMREAVVRRLNEIGRPWEWHEGTQVDKLFETLPEEYFVDVRVAKTDNTAYVTAVLRASEKTRAACEQPLNNGTSHALDRLLQRVSCLRFRHEGMDMFARVALDVEDGLPAEGLFRLTQRLEGNDRVSVVVRRPGETAPEERIPSLSPLLDDLPLGAPRFVGDFAAMIPLSGHAHPREVSVSFVDAGPGFAAFTILQQGSLGVQPEEELSCRGNPVPGQYENCRLDYRYEAQQHGQTGRRHSAAR